jgi:hypothetical protein
MICHVKHISQLKNKYKSIQKKLNNLAFIFKILQIIYVIKDVNIHRQQFLIIINTINLIHQLIKEFKQLFK